MAPPEPEPSAPVILGVDVGGTFTDAVLIDGGRVFAGKAPTTPEDQSAGVLDAIGKVLAVAGRAPGQVTNFSHGMTVATNALLENRSADTAFVADRGFTDLVEIGRQNRASLYRLQASRPAPLVPPEKRIGSAGRNGPEGEITPLTAEDVRHVVERVDRLGVESVAVCLLHADRHPAHEAAIGAALRERFGDSLHVSLSHEVVGTFREYERAATTEVDAALSPLLSKYLGRLVKACSEAGLTEPAIMQSSGGLTSVENAAGHAALTVLSGPAGGAAAAALVSRAAGAPDLLCFDMGGTSCDVCVVEDGMVRETGGKSIGGHPLALPMVDIDTVGAGGGSIAWRDSGGALRVGPRSAGAMPGPAAYGHGGTEPTVTDANLVLGRLSDGSELAGRITLDREAAETAIARLAAELGLGIEQCAEGILRVANSEMVRALRVMTVERGLDPRRFTLLAFGGAGPLHATAIAEELGIERILVPVDGGVFSALGLAAADRRRDSVRTVLLRGEAITAAALTELIGDADEVSWDLRYRGQSFELSVSEPSGDPGRLRESFESAHESMYGYRDEDAQIELVTVRRRYIEPGVSPDLGAARFQEVEGPRSIDLEQATLFLPEGWSARGHAGGLLSISHSKAM
ncbi:MAG TPA: hydantoinase/oxoprolinase family protein [Solirubrobacterales bacterium]|nr:hydantoinase/oxoprolinase family protein [Solirubrobacterales bacterium]